MAKQKIDMDRYQQGIVVFVVFDGKDLPLYLMDDMRAEDVVELVTPASQAVLAARLQFWADAFAADSDESSR